MGTYFIINTSQRKHANSQIIAQKMKVDFESAGHTARIIDCLSADIAPCIGCDLCKNTKNLVCSRQDQLTDMLAAIDSCDGMAVVSPVYWGDVSTQGKAFADRLYAFLDFTDPKYTKATKTDKKLAFVFTSRGMSEGSMDAPVDRLANGSFAIAGFGEHRTLMFNGLGTPGSIADDDTKLARVDEVVDWLVE